MDHSSSNAVPPSSSGVIAPTTSSTIFHALHAGLGGAFAGISTDLIFYGLDSYKVMKQASSAPGQNGGAKIKFSKLFQGVLPIAVIGSGPSFGVFFAGYGIMRDILQNSGVSDSMAVLASSLVNAVPSSIVAVPADVVKKQMLLSSSQHSGSEPIGTEVKKPKITVRSIVHSVYRQHGVRGFFLGWQANMLKDIPFAAIKMSLYESIARIYLRYVVFHDYNKAKSLSQKEGSEKSNASTEGHHHEHLNSDMLNKTDAAIVGFISGAITAVLTNPLDCANTRIKSGELSHFSLVQAHREIVRKDGAMALFRGLLPRTVIIGFGSTVFWFFYALASGSDKQHH